jgi:hypothetical protein
MIKGRALLASWELYRKIGVHKDASLDQVTETRRAFYTGAFSIQSLLVAIADADLPDAKEHFIIGAIQAELDEFQKEEEGRCKKQKEEECPLKP